jgi:hypothetical protein
MSSVRRRDRAVDERGEAADRGHTGERATEGADPGAQQLSLAAQVLEATRGFAAGGLDALQALLAALANRDQLGLEPASALDRESDGVGTGASGRPHPLPPAAAREADRYATPVAISPPTNPSTTSIKPGPNAAPSRPQPPNPHRPPTSSPAPAGSFLGGFRTPAPRAPPAISPPAGIRNPSHERSLRPRGGRAVEADSTWAAMSSTSLAWLALSDRATSAAKDLFTEALNMLP